MRPSLCLVVLLPCTAAGGEVRLLRFTSERAEISVGGHMAPNSLTVLTAEVVPPKSEVMVEFRILPGTGEGKTTPAMLSNERSLTDEKGLAGTILLSSDEEETCHVLAYLAGDLASALELRVDFRRSMAHGTVVAKLSQPVGLGQLVSRAAQLAAQLADPAVEMRTAAKRALLALGREAVPPLVEMAGDVSLPADIRSLAVRCLAEIKDEVAEEQILTLLAHPLSDVRAGAEEAISNMAATRAEAIAVAASTQPDLLVRAAGLRVLGKLARTSTERSKALMPRLEAALEDPDPFVRATAVWELAQLSSPRISEILAMKLHDVSPFVRTLAAKAAFLLTECSPGDSPNLEEALLSALSDNRVEVRCAIAKALGSSKHVSEAHLAAALSDADPRVRRSAVLGLSWRPYSREGLNLLRRALDDPDPQVREIAFRTFAESGTEHELDILIRILDLKEPTLVDSALRTLRRITCLDLQEPAGWKTWYAAHGHKTRTEWLWQALDAPDSQLAPEAALALARIVAPDSQMADALRTKLLALLRTATCAAMRNGQAVMSGRHAIASALVLLGEVAGAEAFAEDMLDPSAYVRLSALRAIGSVMQSVQSGSAIYPKVAAVLVAALEDPQPIVRRIAARLLRELTGESLGYEPNAPPEHRTSAVKRWKDWLGKLARPEKVR